MTNATPVAILITVDGRHFFTGSVFMAWCWLRIFRTGKYPRSEQEAEAWGREEFERSRFNRKPQLV